jgi:ribonuclease G
VDDAVAKIDGYIISIAGAAPCVGEKRMVRIDQVGRTAASALLLDEAGEVVSPPPRPTPRVPARPRRRAPAASAPKAAITPPAEIEVPAAVADAPEGDATPSEEEVAKPKLPRPRKRRAKAKPADEEMETASDTPVSDAADERDSAPEPELVTVAAALDGDSSDEGSEDGLQSKPRRRGRRGGRRRSAAKAKASPE